MLDGYVSMMPSPINLNSVKIGYAINSSSLSAVFPFVSEILMDKKGKFIGYNDEGIPVVFDLFKRDKSRVNSSAVILGKSGQGKSYFSKAFLSKLACDIIDTPALVAVKSHLRNERPLVIAPASINGLSGNAENIGKLLNRRNYYFVPFRQDNPITKPRSIVFDAEYIIKTIKYALEGEQISPILV